MMESEAELLAALGMAQVNALFACHVKKISMDDSEFFPLLEAMLEQFEVCRISQAKVESLWEHAYRLFDRLCKEVEPDSTYYENRDLMRSYLLGSRRLEADDTQTDHD